LIRKQPNEECVDIHASEIRPLDEIGLDVGIKFQGHVRRSATRAVCDRNSILQHDPKCMEQARHVEEDREHDVENQMNADAVFEADRQRWQ
jgi:hypothetical protein